MTTYLLANFGGPRDLNEVGSFLNELLTDRDVIRTFLPNFLHQLLFAYVAKKRTKKIQHDYSLIGGRSPIYFDTELMAKMLSEKLNSQVLTFHRYLKATHQESLEKIKNAQNIKVIPLFPQFSFSTTGSIARFFENHLPTTQHIKWISRYPVHEAYILAFQKRISSFLKKQNINEENTLLFFSAHGLPQRYVDSGDPYQQECIQTFESLKNHFPKAHSILAYQSKFGPGLWLKPYTEDVAENIKDFAMDKTDVVFVPLSFTSDHIETLFEVENLYLPLIRNANLKAHRCPALNCESYWIDALYDISQNEDTTSNHELVFSYSKKLANHM